MRQILNIDEDAISFLGTELFQPMFEGNCILFLGAGASVTNKKFLGKQIIEFYEDEIGKKLIPQTLLNLLI